VQIPGQPLDTGIPVPAGTPAKALEEPCVYCISLCETLFERLVELQSFVLKVKTLASRKDTLEDELRLAMQDAHAPLEEVQAMSMTWFEEMCRHSLVFEYSGMEQPEGELPTGMVLDEGRDIPLSSATDLRDSYRRIAQKGGLQPTQSSAKLDQTMDVPPGPGTPEPGKGAQKGGRGMPSTPSHPLSRETPFATFVTSPSGKGAEGPHQKGGKGSQPKGKGGRSVLPAESKVTLQKQKNLKSLDLMSFFGPLLQGTAKLFCEDLTPPVRKNIGLELANRYIGGKPRGTPFHNSYPMWLGGYMEFADWKGLLGIHPNISSLLVRMHYTGALQLTQVDPCGVPEISRSDTIFLACCYAIWYDIRDFDWQGPIWRRDMCDVLWDVAKEMFASMAKSWLATYGQGLYGLDLKVKSVQPWTYASTCPFCKCEV